ncbi:uncharacterized protein SCHCODRAFT_01177143 [Schizophyllum commune H4-8]|uniref:Uncharacterized protein n=1 Tax=Schizophyllum commune (strain H4-8 / FGSC 9210) TaxID=578458 RepID=D8PYA8_SCHCM|nr:uncharacterized protein SCHCODRAFT_01177143 [Schizophyllum commune H4-8]KAI5897247.1 hypothetical protein SCHCODRAFT_01177143 [Schizophyllum commune H4-8]
MIPLASTADIVPSPQALREAVETLRSALYQSSKYLKVETPRSNLTRSPSDPKLAASVERYNTEIERQADHLQSLIAPLQDLLQRAKLQITHNTALLSAHHRLPQSILSKIFLLVAARERELGRPTYVSHLYNFTRVCDRWRAVALNTPGLCTTFTLWDTETATQYEIFAHELELTGKFPLDVRLRQLKSKTGFQTIKGPTESWELLKKQSKRWRSLTLEINSQEFRIMTPSDQPLDCQSLEALYLNHSFLSPDPSDTDPKYDLPRLFLTVISNATALRIVQIKVNTVGGGRKQKVCFLESWHLTDLSLCFDDCGDATRFLPILKQQANTLERLNFAITKMWARGDGKLGTHATLISMQKLTELSCRLDATPLISCIKAIQLKSLTIYEHPGVLTDCNYNTVSTDAAVKTEDTARKANDIAGKTNEVANVDKTPEPLPSVADRVKTYIHLTSLSISNVEWPTDSLLQVLSELNALKLLKLDESDEKYLGKLVTKTLLQNMKPHECTLVPKRNWTFLMKLEKMHITLSFAAESDVELIELLREMADSRVKAGLTTFMSQFRDPQTTRTTDIWRKQKKHIAKRL